MATNKHVIGNVVVIREFSDDEKRHQLLSLPFGPVSKMALCELSGGEFTVDLITKHGYVLTPNDERSKRKLKLSRIGYAQDSDFVSHEARPSLDELLDEYVVDVDDDAPEGTSWTVTSSDYHTYARFNDEKDAYAFRLMKINMRLNA